MQVWTPDLVQANAYAPCFHSTHSIVSSPNSIPGRFERKILASNYTGQIFMWSDYSFTVPCKFDHGRFPADVQSCCAKIDDSRYFAVRFAIDPAAQTTLTESIGRTHQPLWQIESASVDAAKYSLELMTDWKHDPFAVETTNCALCVKIRRTANYYSTCSIQWVNA